MRTRAYSVLFLVAAMALSLPLSGQTSPGQPNDVTLTIVYDNYAAVEGLRTGWGFGVLLETGDRTILFDTGADGEALLENLERLGKDPTAIEAIVISHAHSDHTGGLEALLAQGGRPKLFTLSSFPEPTPEVVQAVEEVVETSPGQEIVPGIRTTGQVGTEIPEQALILDTKEGPVLLTGCAHPGIILMAERAMELSSGPLHSVLGGFHLMNATEPELETIVSGFQRLGVQSAGATHCSGDPAVAAFREAYGTDFLDLGAGRVLRFPMNS